MLFSFDTLEPWVAPIPLGAACVLLRTQEEGVHIMVNLIARNGSWWLWWLVVAVIPRDGS